MYCPQQVNAYFISQLQCSKHVPVRSKCREAPKAYGSSTATVAADAARLGPPSLASTIQHKHICKACKGEYEGAIDKTQQQPMQLPRIKQAGHRARSATGALQSFQAAAIRAPLQDPPIAQFRFWHDEKRFRGSGDASLAQHVLLAAGGTRMGGNFKEASVQGHMGWQLPDRWDVLWSTSDGALKAAPFIAQGQLISTMPGMECITRKRNLPLTLAEAYGEDAWHVLPRTYSIPAQLQQLRQRLRDEATAMAAAAAGDNTAAAAAGSVTGYYVLKTGEHLGQGLKIVPSSKALSTLIERNRSHLNPPGRVQNPSSADRRSSSSSSSDDENSIMYDSSKSSSSETGHTTNTSSSAGGTISSSSRSTAATVAAQQQQQQQVTAVGGSPPTAAQPPAQLPRPFICVQQYITSPLLVQGHKCGLRLWVLVLGPKPYRAYLYNEGLVLFSTEQYNADMDTVVSQGADTQGHLTNAAQNRSGDVWPLSKLLSGLGPAAAARLQQQLAATAGKVVAAAAPAVQAAAAQLQLPDGTCAFELLGMDFVLDCSLQPWLLEVNASPSLAWEHDQPETQTLIRLVKTNMLVDMVALLRLQDRFPLGNAIATQQQQQQRGQQQQTASGNRAHGKQQDMLLQQLLPQQDGANGSEPLHQQQQQQEEGRQDQRLGQTSRASQCAGAAVNPLLVQAASAKYFADRPHVLHMVLDTAKQLQAAVAAAPCMRDVQQHMEQLLQQNLHRQSEAYNCGMENSSSSCSNSTDAARSSSFLVDCGRGTINPLVELEAERQSAGGWQSLMLPVQGTLQQ